MEKLIVLPILRDGLPDSGVVPHIRIRDADTKSVEVDFDAMEEVGDGWFRYYFQTYNPKKNYVVTVEVVNSEGNIIYYFASNVSYVEDMKYVIKGPVARFNP